MAVRDLIFCVRSITRNLTANCCHTWNAYIPGNTALRLPPCCSCDGVYVSIKAFFRLDLRRLILLLAFATAAITLINGLYASYKVQRQLLIDQALENNFVYASKLAASTDNFLDAAQQQLAYSAMEITSQLHDESMLFQTAERLRKQTDSFNSVVIVDASGMVLATSPDTLQLQGEQLASPGALQALKEQRPLISAPYISAVGNLLVSISQPLFSTTGEYLGYIGGSLYLQKRSILNDLLGKHYYQDGSYIYVVDQNKRLLYHPQPDRVGNIVYNNTVIDAVTQGKSGTGRLHNSTGLEILAGYAPINNAGWGVVAQSPLSSTLTPLNTLMRTVVDHTLPLALITLLLIWWLARLISRPLWQLADSAQSMDESGSPNRIQDVRSWYFESSELKRAMLIGVSLLHNRMGKLQLDAQTDPLTGLSNRRGAENTLTLLKHEHTPFSILAIDIDHFKRVNDTYGHDCGDLALKSLALLMRACTRKDDQVCRMGGEEFLIILPNTNEQVALELAERLRLKVQNTEIEPIGKITVSIGIAGWNDQKVDTAYTLKAADKALYKAKAGGRNRCEGHHSAG
ncbi:diguanylate cyclase (GGDEF)-like protein [Marinobacterium halophilum]|uniref:diguanylate cyclase n=1 Tax=Marinobacterium halophilum TaxID=267374 RepID=A0A2P8EUN1_9GAMM|nr:diguanylate cyclase (GGDEF)-like protein [Marinobacterium halophilum]